MKLTKIISETLQKVMGEDISGLSLKRKSSQTWKPDESGYDDHQTITKYDIIRKGKVIGNLRYEDYFGDVSGTLFGKDLPDDVGEYGNSQPLNALRTFLKSSHGQAWLKKNKIDLYNS